MGFNTVVFMLNDCMHSIEESPHAAIWKLTHPPMGNDELENRMINQSVDAVAKEHGEPRLHFQAIEVVPTFHADYTSFFRAGQNTIDRCEIHKYTTVKMRDGTYKNAVVLILPDYLQDKEK